LNRKFVGAVGASIFSSGAEMFVPFPVLAWHMLDFGTS
jgi:hypothetical protein